MGDLYGEFPYNIKCFNCGEFFKSDDWHHCERKKMLGDALREDNEWYCEDCRKWYFASQQYPKPYPHNNCKEGKLIDKIKDVDSSRTSMLPIKENFQKLENWLYSIMDFYNSAGLTHDDVDPRDNKDIQKWYEQEYSMRSREFNERINDLITTKLTPQELINIKKYFKENGLD